MSMTTNPQPVDSNLTHMSPWLFPSTQWRRLVRFWLTAVVLLLPKPCVAQSLPNVQVVGQPQWGFDGRVVPGQFTPLAILLDNLSSEPVEGELSLRCVTGMMRESPGVHVTPLFIGPNSRRWFHFFPYVSGSTDVWRLVLQTADGEVVELNEIGQGTSIFRDEQTNRAVRVAVPAVLLDPVGVASRFPTTIKHMSAEAFPPYSTATASLGVLFLDHVPDWETPRQTALLGWLKQGGRLHLLLDQNGQQLSFSGLLSPLNEPFSEFAVGSGIVQRHDIQRGALTAQIVDAATGWQKRDALDPEEQSRVDRATETGLVWQSGSLDDRELFSLLRERTQPEHAWWLLFLLAMMYVGLIFPGCWLLSKQPRLHFSVTYGAILGLATLFSLFFIAIGRRGYGESTVVHTLAVARAEDATTWQVFGYDSLFVISGDQYRIEDTNHETLLASEPGDDSTDARITSGNTASFVTRIPPFSSQSILSHRRLQLPDWNLQIKGFSQSGVTLSSLTIGFGRDFPADEIIPEPSVLEGLSQSGAAMPERPPQRGLVKCFVLHGSSIHDLLVDRAKNELILQNSRTKLSDFCSPTDLHGRMTFSPFGTAEFESLEADPLEECYRRALPQLARRMLLNDFVSRVQDFALRPGFVRVLVYAPFPKPLELPTSAEARRVGRILFVRELPLASQVQDSDGPAAE